MKLNVSL